MKKLKILLVTLLLLTTVGCNTVPKAKVTLPPKPKRQELQAPETLTDYALIINYYEHLVQEWELWGETASSAIKCE